VIAWVLVHDLGRSGVPVALARMLEWHASEDGGELELHVVAGNDGPLGPRMAASAASLTTLEPEAGRTLPTTLAAGAAQLWPGRRALGRIGFQFRDAAWRQRVRTLPEPDVVLVHGAGAWVLWHALLDGRSAVPYVIHLHELALGLSRSVPDAFRPSFLGSARLILAVDPTVAALVRGQGVAASQIRIVPGIADEATRRRAPAVTTDLRSVVGIGPAGWRKGADRFVAVAHEVRRSRPEVNFHWIGGAPQGPDVWGHDTDLPVTWHRATADPWALVDDDALLLVPSREDPLPLIVLEAGVRSVPVVVAATGGLPGLVEAGRGSMVAGHDLEAMAEAVVRCIDEPGTARRGADTLRKHVEEHHRVAVVGPGWRRSLREAASPTPKRDQTPSTPGEVVR
jgi:glycosyltransferase involved in cell wall biosynthesis